MAPPHVATRSRTVRRRRQGMFLLGLLALASLVLAGPRLAPRSFAEESTPATAANGLRGEYFDNCDHTSLKLTRIDPTIDFNWGEESPGKDIEPDTFAIRWTGEILIDHSETYTFKTVSNDGVRLWVDGRQVIDQWTDQPIAENSGTIDLVGERWHPITVEYFDTARVAQILLAYSSPNTPSQVVPTDHLRPAPAGILPTPAPRRGSIEALRSGAG